MDTTTRTLDLFKLPSTALHVHTTMPRRIHMCNVEKFVLITDIINNLLWYMANDEIVPAVHEQDYG